MLNQLLIIARKECKESLRDFRSLISSLFYLLMGPAVVLLIRAAKPGSTAVLGAMTSIFVLVSAFSGGMNLAMDTIAGERERRSLLPLLLNPISRRRVVFGKSLAVVAFSSAGMIINVAAFSIVLSNGSMLLKLPVLLPLALLATSLEILISASCRSVKEAHTYLSFLIFLPMFSGFLVVFLPHAFADWTWVVPILGQQTLLAGQMTNWQAAALFLSTSLAALLVLISAGHRLERDDAVYGS